MTEKQHKSFLYGFDEWENLWRFCIACGVIGLILLFLGWLLFKRWGVSIEGSNLKVSAGSSGKATIIEEIDTTPGGIHFKTGNGGSVNSIILPANQIWMDTKISVASGSKVSIVASGSISLDTSRVLQLARDPGSLPLKESNFVVNPDGESLNKRSIGIRQADKQRQSLSIAQREPLGKLLAVVVPSHQAPGRDNFRPGVVFPIGSENDFEYIHPNGSTGILYLTVNDFIASSSSEDRETWLLQDNDQEVWDRNIRQTYLKPSDPVEKIREQVEQLEKKWDSIVQAELWEAFFEDNSGFVLVSVEVSKR